MSERRSQDLVSVILAHVAAQRVGMKVCDPFCMSLALNNTMSAIGLEAHSELPPLFYGGRIFVFSCYTIILRCVQDSRCIPSVVKLKKYHNKAESTTKDLVSTKSKTCEKKRRGQREMIDKRHTLT